MSNIRKLEKSDFAQWLKLWNLYLQFYEKEIDDDLKRDTFKRIIFSNSNIHCAVYEEAGEILGIVHYIYHPSTWTNGNYCYLQDLYVLAEHRGKQIGKALIEKVYADAEANHCSRVYWLTHESNATAMRLYDRVADKPGFVQYRKNLPQ